MAAKRWPKKERETKNYSPPLVMTQPINKVTKGHKAYNYVHLGPTYGYRLQCTTIYCGECHVSP